VSGGEKKEEPREGSQARQREKLLLQKGGGRSSAPGAFENKPEGRGDKEK